MRWMTDPSWGSEASMEVKASSLDRLRFSLPSSLPSHSFPAHGKVWGLHVHVLQSVPARDCTRVRHGYDVSDGTRGPCSCSLITFITNVLRHVFCISSRWSSRQNNAFRIFIKQSDDVSFLLPLYLTQI